MKLMENIQRSTTISDDFEISTVVYLNGPSDVLHNFTMGRSFSALAGKLEARNTSEAWLEYLGNAQIQRAGQS